MPVSTEAPRCSEFARSIGVLPPGSGLFLRRAVLVSVPLPWPKPATNHPSISTAAAALAASSEPSRLFAAEPIADDIVVEVYERRGAHTVLHRWRATSVEAVETLAGEISRAAVGDLDAVSSAAASIVEVEADLGPTFLICTQGSHDTCCGTTGVALADEIESQRPSYVVRRVSHTGGHRFSPTLLAFPEGRMWAFADLGLVDRIASATTSPQDHRNHARGWWGARIGVAQVAECAVRAELTATPFREPVLTSVADTAAGKARFDVTVGDRAWRVDVHVERTIPTIACEAPGGLPAKPGREFGWSIEEV